MTLQQLQDFIAVAQNGSLHAAARATGQAQPAISKSLARLEKSIGAPLLVRASMGARLTPFGERLLGHARTILGETEKAKASIAQLQGDQGSIVRYGISPMASFLLAGSVAKQFRRHHPEVQLNSTSGIFNTLTPLLREGQFEFALCHKPALETSDLLSQELLHCPYCMVVRAGHPKMNAVSLSEIQGESFLAGAPRSNMGSGMAAVFASVGLSCPRIEIYSDSLLDHFTFLKDSDLIAMVPSVLAENPLTRDAISILPIKEDLGEYNLTLLTRRDTHLIRAAATLTNLFEREGHYLMTELQRGASGKLRRIV